MRKQVRTGREHANVRTGLPARRIHVQCCHLKTFLMMNLKKAKMILNNMMHPPFVIRFVFGSRCAGGNDGSARRKRPISFERFARCRAQNERKFRRVLRAECGGYDGCLDEHERKDACSRSKRLQTSQERLCTCIQRGQCQEFPTWSRPGRSSMTCTHRTPRTDRARETGRRSEGQGAQVLRSL